ncbi:uncharacterized protein LOC114944406 isoform X2 [Nylanderia fulva]|uniref:uncharacterized protein LOC114944406 isoform X2 n=1 Tax=Nylanderia fulva TaxID=613905 RepID=UPI0010FAD12E|nr:uncharacterized protein LOC114944406 isoform X2 [Nylanderia fulva]
MSVFLQFIKSISIIDVMKLVMYLALFCNFSNAVTDVKNQLHAFPEKISWINWEQSRDFKFNPDDTFDTVKMIRREGYPAETHVVTTEDGYLLVLHRIPGGNDSLPVLLQHAVLCTSADWIILGKGKALAYLLADQGYDVWLGNFRGNTYSRAHISLSPLELKFWDFSFHEMGIYDLPAMIKFITNMKSQPLHTYVGHSMGTTSFYIMASERPEIARMVQKMINFAPAVFLDQVESPIKYIFPFWKEIKMFIRLFFHDEFLPQNDLLRFISKYICPQNFITQQFCADPIFLICGNDQEQFNYTLLPVILGVDPAGTSIKTILHFIQLSQASKFRRYDYGREKNLLIYNSSEPPDYNLTNTTLPIALFYAPGDLLVNSVVNMSIRVQFIKSIFIIDTMRLIMYLALFCNFSNALEDVKNQLHAFTEKISWINWEQSRDFKFISDDTFDTIKMIKREGYPAETHVVTTEDGYLLVLHRIPGGNNSLPVLLQHGMLCTSADWIILGKGKALAYLLADQGYDVWLGNFRGNTYSRAHISLSPLELKFWDFSFHEMGIYDLPVMIKFITNMKSQPLHAYVGHSMGATSFYVMASERPEIARMVQKMINFAPGVFLDKVESALKYINPFLREFKIIMRLFFHDELLPQNDFLKFTSKYICNRNFTTQQLCTNIIFLICGSDPEQFNYTLLPVILGVDPAGTSTKTFLHFNQINQASKFRQYDYGREKNLLMYNLPEPPDYNLANTTLPIALFYGLGDLIVNIVSVKRLYRILPNVIDLYEVPWRNFNHVDFIWAKDAPKLVYERVIKIMRNENINNVTSTK